LILFNYFYGVGRPLEYDELRILNTFEHLDGISDSKLHNYGYFFNTFNLGTMKASVGGGGGGGE
jgi:hypothetical protein